jgi:hypothetical protein
VLVGIGVRTGDGVADAVGAGVAVTDGATVAQLTVVRLACAVIVTGPPQTSWLVAEGAASLANARPSSSTVATASSSIATFFMTGDTP